MPLFTEPIPDDTSRCNPFSPISRSMVDNALLGICDVCSAGGRWGRAALASVPLVLGSPLFLASDKGLLGAMKLRFVSSLGYTIHTLGPTAVKFLQWASTRPDLFPDSVCDEFAKYHSRVPPTSWPLFVLSWANSAAHAGDHTALISPARCGAGSVAQVYPTWVPSISKPGRYIGTVAKILRPGVEVKISQDLKLMQCVAYYVAKLLGGRGRWLPIESSVEQFAQLMRPQCDLINEAQSMRTFRANFRTPGSQALINAAGGRVVVPRVHGAYTQRTVLALDMERGISLKEYEKLLRRGDVPQEVARLLANVGAYVFLQMLVFDNFVHADLHPGNILIRRTPPVKGPALWNWARRRWRGLRTIADGSQIELVLLDSGLTSHLRLEDRINFLDLLRAVAFGEGYQAGRLLLKRSKLEECEDAESFCNTIADLVQHFVGPRIRVRDLRQQQVRSRFVISKLKMGEVMRKVLSASLTYKVQLDPAFVGILLSTTVLEGVGRGLDPDMDLLAVARPFLRKMLSVRPPSPSRKSLLPWGLITIASHWRL